MEILETVEMERDKGENNSESESGGKTEEKIGEVHENTQEIRANGTFYLI